MRIKFLQKLSFFGVSKKLITFKDFFQCFYYILLIIISTSSYRSNDYRRVQPYFIPLPSGRLNNRFNPFWKTKGLSKLQLNYRNEYVVLGENKRKDGKRKRIITGALSSNCRRVLRSCIFAIWIISFYSFAPFVCAHSFMLLYCVSKCFCRLFASRYFRVSAFY